MKKIICFFLCICCIILCFFNFKTPVSQNLIYKTMDISDFLISIYQNEYTESEVRAKISDLSNSEYVYSFYVKEIDSLKQDRPISIETWKELSVRNDSDFSYGDIVKVETPRLVVEGVECIMISEIIDSLNFTVDDITYELNYYDIPLYENMVSSIDYSFIFHQVETKDNFVFVSYISKGTNDIWTYTFEYDLLGRLKNIEIDKGV